MVLHPYIEALLRIRGLSSEDFLSHLSPKSQLLQENVEVEEVVKARERIKKALRKKEPVLVFGDYDVDGSCGAAITARALLNYTEAVRYFIPDRLKHGYGLTTPLIQKIHRRGFKLLITVDCGVRNAEEIQRASELGIDTIVIDHHVMGKTLPPAYALIHPGVTPLPKRFSYLCGTSLAFLVFSPFLHDAQREDFAPLLSMATVTDLAPLLGENRALVKQAPQLLQQSNLPGLKALLQVARAHSDIDPQMLMGYILGPRINAAGRVGKAARAVELFLAENEEAAKAIALALDEQNEKRRKIQKKIYEEAEFLARQKQNKQVLFLYRKGWHLGVLGIVAAKLAREYQKPCLLATEVGDGLFKGSGRSVPGVPLLSLLEQSEDFFERFGGHSQAVGFALKEENLEKTEESLCQRSELYKKGEIIEDLEVKLSRLDRQFFAQYADLPPFGPCYEAPLFRSSETVHLQNGIIRTPEHLLYYTFRKRSQSNKGKIFFTISTEKERFLIIEDLKEP